VPSILLTVFCISLYDCPVHVLDVGLTIEKPFDGRYSNLDDPATVELTKSICAGVRMNKKYS